MRRLQQRRVGKRPGYISIAGILIFQVWNSVTLNNHLPQRSEAGNNLDSAKEDNHLPEINRIYSCGYRKPEFFDEVFPEYSDVPSTTLTRMSVANATDKDLIINGYHGFCDGWGQRKLGPEWMSKNFPGKAIHVNGEPFGGDLWDQEAPHPRQYHIGYVKDSPQSIRVPFLAIALMKEWKFLLSDHSKKPKGKRSEFMIYIASNCKDFREEAAGRLSEISNIHYGGKCKGNVSAFDTDSNSTNNKRSSSQTPYFVKGGNSRFMTNIEVYAHYRFCLVMENTKLDGYITEKIMLAFVGGCIPVYWGTREIFDLFNERAFIYYDIDNPLPAINRIVHLESNRTAYDQVMNEPILKNGMESYNQYLSIDDVVGNGSLKKKIRNTLFPPPLLDADG